LDRFGTDWSERLVKRLARPDPSHRRELSLKLPPALGRRGASRTVIILLRTQADAKRQSSAREHVERGGLLGEQGRWA